MPKAKHLEKRVKQIKEKKFDWMLEELMNLSEAEMKKRYAEREWEPEPYDPNWQPKETKYLIIED